MSTQSADDIREIAPGTIVDGRYKVVRSIGHGGNGMVYEVEHARTGRKLALKALIDETGFARLEQEARAASMMKNGHTARIIDMEPSGPTGAYLVMELLEGQSLRGLLDDAGQLPVELTVNIAMQICECLQEAHALGIIHRDLKPENVFLCASPWPGQYDVKVLDFGVMKIADDGGAIPKSSLTRTGSTVGTPYYMSLEQLRNSSAVDARADVYSLGVVLYECLSGRKPFQAETIGDLVYALCSGPPTQLVRIRPDVPADVGALVMRTLSAKREDRPGGMLDVALALLPFANAAFGLWVKVGGKQPALARASSANAAGVAPPPAPSGPGPIVAVPAPIAAAPIAAPRPVVALPRLKTAVLAPLEEKPREPLATTPPPVLAEDTPPARRDTPTEMFVKGVHDPDAEDDDDLSRGDRDTPTRALDMSALPVRRDHDDEGSDLPTFDGRSVDGRSHGADPIPIGDYPSAVMPTAKLVLPPEAYAPIVVPVAPPSAPAAVGSPSDLPKPQWQVTLDRALFAVGGFTQKQITRFRAAPQNTQIIIAIIAGTLTIMVVGTILFIWFHSSGPRSQP